MRTAQECKDQRAELVSLVLDMTMDPDAVATSAIARVQKEIGSTYTIPDDQRQLMRAAAIVAAQNVMAEVRVMCGRKEP